MNKIKEELELLKSWGFETVSIDKVLEMIEGADNTESEFAEKSVINIFYPPHTEEGDRVDRYFREIPMYVSSDKPYPLYNKIYRTTGTSIPESNVWIF